MRSTTANHTLAAAVEAPDAPPAFPPSSPVKPWRQRIPGLPGRDRAKTAIVIDPRPSGLNRRVARSSPLARSVMVRGSRRPAIWRPGEP